MPVDTRLCQVCSHPAKGLYFGANVCLPCKSFYIRSTRDGASPFICQNSVECKVTGKSGRIRCQFCRFQRCLAEGMRRKERPDEVIPEAGQTLCQVCQDIANGVHFGVSSCEGCKKFFRRCMKEGRRYVCNADMMCAVNPRTRNCCRFCRYQKCLRVGMSRRATKMGRPKKAGKTTYLSQIPHNNVVTSFVSTSTVSCVSGASSFQETEVPDDALSGSSNSKASNGPTLGTILENSLTCNSVFGDSAASLDVFFNGQDSISRNYVFRDSPAGNSAFGYSLLSADVSKDSITCADVTKNGYCGTGTSELMGSFAETFLGTHNAAFEKTPTASMLAGASVDALLETTSSGTMATVPAAIVPEVVVSIPKVPFVETYDMFERTSTANMFARTFVETHNAALEKTISNERMEKTISNGSMAEPYLNAEGMYATSYIYLTEQFLQFIGIHVSD